MSNIKLHLGCGNKIMPGWVNIDQYHPEAPFHDNCIILKNYEENSIDEIYTCHMIEHIFRSEFKKGLKRWFQILKPNGILIIRCPNFEPYIKSYQKTENLKELEDLINYNKHRGEGHINRYFVDKESLIEYIEEAGFKIIECRLASQRHAVSHLTSKGLRDEGINDHREKSDLWCKAIKEKK